MTMGPTKKRTRSVLTSNAHDRVRTGSLPLHAEAYMYSSLQVSLSLLVKSCNMDMGTVVLLNRPALHATCGTHIH
jgi:hypothetical protein